MYPMCMDFISNVYLYVYLRILQSTMFVSEQACIYEMHLPCSTKTERVY